MRTITITGDYRHIENIVKENRGRVERGFVSISEGTEVKAPAAPKTDSKKVVTDSKKAPAADTKDVNPKTK